MASCICLMFYAMQIPPVQSAELSPYMGGEGNLTKAPNGAVVRKEVVKTGAQILHLEPTTEEIADGVWCIGGYSLANTTVMEAKDGLIVYETGDTKEEAEHIRDAIHRIYCPGFFDDGSAGTGREGLLSETDPSGSGNHCRIAGNICRFFPGAD